MIQAVALLVGGVLTAISGVPTDAGPAVQGLLAEYRFENLDGLAVPDQQGRWPGRIVGEVRLAEGRPGQALALDGNGYVEVPGSDKPVYERGLSVEAWICPDKLAAGRIVDRSTPATSDSFCLDTHPGDAIRFIYARRDDSRAEGAQTRPLDACAGRVRCRGRRTGGVSGWQTRRRATVRIDGEAGRPKRNPHRRRHGGRHSLRASDRRGAIV